MISDPPRIPSIDGLRGVLAAYIVVFHAACCAGFDVPLSTGALTVGVFFIISGYVLTPRWQGNYPAFLIRRFLRLWPVYAVCLIAGALIVGVKLTWTDFAFYPVFPSAAAFQADGPVWSLYVEAWAMLAIPFIVWSGKTLPRVIVGVFVWGVLGHFEFRFGNGALFTLGSYLSRYRFDVTALNWRVPQWLGKVSYSLYLTHDVVYAAFAKFFPGVNVLLTIPLAFLVGYLVWASVERYSINLSRRAATIVTRGSAVRGLAQVAAPILVLRFRFDRRNEPPWEDGKGTHCGRSPNALSASSRQPER